MIKVSEIFNAINAFAPFKTQLDFDNSGLLVGSENSDVDKVAISLDATVNAITIAAEKGCNLLVTHHPIIFSPLKSITSDEAAFVAVKHGVSVISAHTNLDAANGGVNDCLAKAIGLKDISVLSGSGDVPMARIGKLNAVSSQSFAAYLKKELNCGGVKYVDKDGCICKVAVCGGAGGDFIEAAFLAGADAYVTGECRHHERLLAKKLGIALFECGHYSTEQVVKQALADLISKLGVAVEIIEEKDPANYI